MPPTLLLGPCRSQLLLSVAFSGPEVLALFTSSTFDVRPASWTFELHHQQLSTIALTTRPFCFALLSASLITPNAPNPQLPLPKTPNPNTIPQSRDMAPTRSKKPKSTESTGSVDIQKFPVPPQMIPTKTRSPARTPPNNRSPIKKQKMGITLAQKQALIDNLQLESTLTSG